MSMKFIMIGCGWRAQYFLRAAEILSDRLEVSAIVMHSEKRAQEIQQETGILTTTDLETALDTKPEFALLCVPRSVMKEWDRCLVVEQRYCMFLTMLILSDSCVIMQSGLIKAM